MKRIVAYAVTFAVLLIGVLVLYAWQHYSPAGEVIEAGRVAHIELPHRFRNGPEHDAARQKIGTPYILEANVEDGGSLLYYGASHSQDPKHPQIADITERWEAFNPTVALYEGRRRGFYYGALIEPFAGLPEPALVHKLARRDGVMLYSLEPEYKDEVAWLTQKYTPEQVALYFFLRVYTSEAGGTANESLAKDLLAKRTDVEGLRGTLETLDDVDALWAREFPDHGDWRTLQGEPGFLADISTDSRIFRGQHMARILMDLVDRGQRVFAVVGSGHVIRQEWNLREVFGLEPAWDQPNPTQ